MDVTIHFIDPNFCLCSYLLDVKELLDNPTGGNIAEHLSEIMNDSYLSSTKLSGVATDTATHLKLLIHYTGAICLALAILFSWLYK